MAGVALEPDEPADAFGTIHTLLLEAARRLELLSEVVGEVVTEMVADGPRTDPTPDA